MLDQTESTTLALNDALSTDAQYFEYTSSANPIGAKLISRVPYRSFAASLYDSGPTRIVPLDLSAELGCPGPATGPGLAAHFVRIVAGETIAVAPNATSMVFYAIDGSGIAAQGDVRFQFAGGDFFTMPGGAEVQLTAESTTRLYYVNDAPLLTYLGVAPAAARFTPTLYPAERAAQELQKVSAAPGARQRNRVSILLGNARFPQTRTVTHSLWAMFGVVAPGTTQKPHRHQSIALDFISAWEPGMAFVTPPGYWHAHFNESGANGYVIPIQDAGLQTYLRSLDIRFAR